MQARVLFSRCEISAASRKGTMFDHSPVVAAFDLPIGRAASLPRRDAECCVSTVSLVSGSISFPSCVVVDVFDHFNVGHRDQPFPEHRFNRGNKPRNLFLAIDDHGHDRCVRRERQ